MKRFHGIDANSAHDNLGEPHDDFGAQESFVFAQKSLTARRIRQLRKLREIFFTGNQFVFRDAHSNPIFLKLFRRRSMHFWRVNPMDPTASPSSAAISA